VTCLFADVVDSTRLVEQVDAEDWTEIMNRAFELMAEAIQRYEGTIARLMGDAILAFFGAPVAHEDDPRRAVQAALDLLEATGEYAAQVKRRYGVDFAMRVGLNTGPVVVGVVGSDLVSEYTAMGDAINLAARMQSAAPPMTALIAESTYRFVEPFFDCVDLGLVAVKGKTEAVHAYRVRAAKAQPGSLRGLAGLRSPMVGREAELERLAQLSQAVRRGIGRAALIVGEAGLGKSRLLQEWRATDEEAPGEGRMRWAVGEAASYGRGMPYSLAIHLLHSLLGIVQGAREAERLARLQAVTAEVFGRRQAEFYPYLGHLLGLPLAEAELSEVRMVDSQELRRRYGLATRELVRGLARRQPLALALDDMHWADPSSVELLRELFPLVREEAVLFCCLTRPEDDAPGWTLVEAMRESLQASLMEVELHSLAEADSGRLVANLLGVERLPETLREPILKKADGNPFFVEEVIRMLIERRAIEGGNGAWAAKGASGVHEIPDNLQSLLLARIDRLPETLQHTLRVAAVIGRQFSVEVLEEVMGERG